MVKRISQETFDEVVKENVEQFSMTPEEAIKDAIEQFKAQGVNLDNILVEDLNKLSESECETITNCLNALSDILKKKTHEKDECLRLLLILKNECEKGVPYRVLAGKHGAYNLLLDILDEFNSDSDVILAVLKTLTSLMFKQPDLLNSQGILKLIHFLNNDGQEIQLQALKWCRVCCIKHENNRQDLFLNGIVSQVKKMLSSENVSESMIKNICGVIRVMVLDDDIRVEFGNAHVHAKSFADETLNILTELLQKFKSHQEVMTDILKAITILMVRGEYCETLEKAGVLSVIIEIMDLFPNDEKLILQCLQLLKAMAGNDDIKGRIISAGAAPFIVASLNKNKHVDTFSCGALSCIAALTLRSPSNSKAFMEAEAASAILNSMKFHENDSTIQKYGSWAIRNIVSRDRSLTKDFLSQDAEVILQTALKKHSQACEYDVKSALRDLGCDVEFRELWTGTGGALN